MSSAEGGDKLNADVSAPAPLPPSWVAAPAALALLLFLRTVAYDFVNWDDPMYVTANARILDDSLGGLLRLWDPTAPYRGEFLEYFPLRDSLYWLLHALFGVTPWPFHLLNVLLHAAVCASVGPVLVRLGVPREGALVGALLFAAHPVHVESVAWISSTKDSLYTLFALAMLGAWTRAESPRQLATVGLLLVGGLLVKAMIIVLPLQLLLVDLILKRRPPAQAVRRAAPLVALAGLATLNFIAIGSANDVIVSLKGGTWLANTLTALWGLVSYVSTLVLPLDLNPRYVVPPVTELLSVRGLAGVVVGLVFLGVSVGLARARPRLSFGFALYATSLVSIVGFIPTSIEVADHYQYAAILGYCYLLGWGFMALRERSSAAAAAGATGVVVVLLCAATVQITPIWRDSLSLWERALDQPQADALPRMRYNYGLALLGAGRVDEGLEQLSLLANARLPPKQTLPARAVLAKMALQAGNVGEAVRLLGHPAPDDIAERFADDHALLALHEGDVERAATFAARSTGRHSPTWHRLILAAIAEQRGEVEAADVQLAASVAADASRCSPGGLRPLPPALQTTLAPRLAALCQGGAAPVP
jgi:hypothetical protein